MALAPGTYAVFTTTEGKITVRLFEAEHHHRQELYGAGRRRQGNDTGTGAKPPAPAAGGPKPAAPAAVAPKADAADPFNDTGGAAKPASPQSRLQNPMRQSRRAMPPIRSPMAPAGPNR